MANSNDLGSGRVWTGDRNRSYLYLIVVLFAAAIYIGCIISPPSLMDDVDAVQAQIARNMLTSHDWVSPSTDGVPYFEKAPLIYWMIAVSYKVFGVHDWAARLPVALSAIALAWLTAAFGMWAFGRRAGFYAGLCMATCVGLFLFTRIQIPDVMLVATIALAMWAFLRALEEDESHPRLWAFLLAASMGVGLLLKSLIGVVFPAGAALVYLFLTKQLFVARTWKRLHPIGGTAVILLIAAPWHVLATLRNPPYFAWTLQSGPGLYHGFLWFFFINEQLLRFLNLRYPRDYNTVPRLWFWLFHLVWLFPWSVYFPAVAKLSFKPVDRAGRTRLLALCWAGFILAFFTFSTTQEYYSMPLYPAFALLLGSAMAAGGAWVRRGTRALCVITGACAAGAIAILIAVRNVPTPGDISQALSEHPGAYTLSLGHMEDLTLHSFAYLRFPLLLAAIAFLIGMAGTIRISDDSLFISPADERGQSVPQGAKPPGGNELTSQLKLRPPRSPVFRLDFIAAAIMMVLFFQAARIAMVAFDPYMSSRPLANAMLKSPPGKLMVDHHYYEFSSIFFYTGENGYLINGRFNNLVYGSYAPNSADPFVDDSQFAAMWRQSQRYYLVADGHQLQRFERLAGPELNIIASSGGKFLATNHPVVGSQTLRPVGNPPGYAAESSKPNDRNFR